MARKNEYGKFIISAGEVGSYTVCPEAWRLQSVVQAKSAHEKKMREGTRLHKEWGKRHEDAMRLAYHARLTVPASSAYHSPYYSPQSMTKEALGGYIVQFLYDVAAIDSRIVMLVILLVISVMVLDAVFWGAAKQRSATGIKKEASTVSIEGSSTLPVREYISHMQGLAGIPDAIISEGGFVIPVERKPFAKKVRDRYVAQLLVYMRLVEEFEGKRPPYGYLILGPKCRSVKIGKFRRSTSLA